MINTALKAYTAGLIDGEGSIQINPVISKTSKYKFWGLTIQVSSCCFETLNYLKNEWNLGNITSWHPSKGKAKQKSYNWRLYSVQAGKLLEAILPFLQTKKENALLALEFRKYIGKKRGSVTPHMREQRQIIALKLRELNRKYGKGKSKKLNLDKII